jgi:putative endonuclease
VETGKAYEQAAASFLEKQGFQILERNFRCRQGEVDIIGIHENCLVFVEVKYRKNDRAGVPEEAVGVWKQLKICRTSDYFRMCRRKYEKLQVRYDVVAIQGEEIRWYQNAFPYQRERNQLGW